MITSVVRHTDCGLYLPQHTHQYLTSPGLHKLPGYKHQVYQDIRIIQDNAREVTKSFAELCRLVNIDIIIL